VKQKKIPQLFTAFISGFALLILLLSILTQRSQALIPFVPDPSVLMGVQDGDVHFADYDGDGETDIFLTGENVTGTGVSLFYAGASGDYTYVSGTNVIGLINSAADWGDYDNDGDLDLVIIGEDEEIAKTLIYRNDDGFNFTDVTTGTLQRVQGGDVEWGDYDNDGDLDILLAGSDGGSLYTAVYRNDTGFFVDTLAAIDTIVLITYLAPPLR